MKVWIVSWETNRQIGGEPDQVVVAVYASRASAAAEQTRRIEEAKANGRAVWGYPSDAADWDDDFHVEAWEVEP